MAIKECDKASRARYKKKVRRYTLELYPGTDGDIIAHLDRLQGARGAYIKRVIRDDMALEQLVESVMELEQLVESVIKQDN